MEKLRRSSRLEREKGHSGRHSCGLLVPNFSQSQTKNQTEGNHNGGSDPGTTKIRHGALLRSPRRPPAVVQTGVVPLPRLRFRILHFGASHFRPLRHASLRAQQLPLFPQPRTN